MEDDQRRAKQSVVWAAVFLTISAAWGLTIVAFTGTDKLIPVAIAFVLGALVSFITVPLLLLTDGCGPGLLWVGRILICLEALLLAVGCLIGVSLMI